jgi:hypothetical protein
MVSFALFLLLGSNRCDSQNEIQVLIDKPDLLEWTFRRENREIELKLAHSPVIYSMSRSVSPGVSLWKAKGVISGKWVLAL